MKIENAQAKSGYVSVYCANDISDYNYFPTKAAAQKNAAFRIFDTIGDFTEAMANSHYDFEDVRSTLKEMIEAYKAQEYGDVLELYGTAISDIEYEVYVYVDDCSEGDQPELVMGDVDEELNKILEAAGVSDPDEDEASEDEEPAG